MQAHTCMPNHELFIISADSERRPIRPIDQYKGINQAERDVISTNYNHPQYMRSLQRCFAYTPAAVATSPLQVTHRNHSHLLKTAATDAKMPSCQLLEVVSRVRQKVGGGMSLAT